jgi:ankyrin repeat protein
VQNHNHYLDISALRAMDPVGTLWSIAAIGVTLQEFVESYEDAPASLSSIKAQIQVVETGVRRVQEWLHFTDPRSRAEVQESLQAAIATVDSSMKSLKGTLDSILHSGPRATKLLGRQGSDRWTQTKFAWNEKILNRHLTDMRECALLLTFTLTVCQLPTGRPAEHAIEELGSVARTLSRAHKSTRSRRRAMLTEAETTTSQDQSPELRVLIEGVLAAEDEFPEEENPGDATQQSTTVPPATRRRLQKKRQSSEPSVAFLDTENTASRTRNDELFFGGPTVAPERRPVIPSKSSQSILRKPLPTRNGSSADDLNHSRAEQPPGMLVNPMRQMNNRARSTPNLVASTPPEVGTPLPHRKTFPHETPQPTSSIQSLENDGVRGQSPEQVTHATREPPSHRTTPTEWQTARTIDPAYEEGTRQALSLDMPEKGSYTADSRSSSPPPYLSPTMSQLTLSDNGDASAPEQAPIPISAEVLESKLAVVANKDIDSSTCPALIQAVRANDEDLVKSLLEQGADTNEQDQDTTCTALMEAARLSRREMCRRLLQRGTRLNHKDLEGRTALHMAARRDDAIVCRMLLDAGAQVSICDKNNCTPLRLAAQSGSHEAVACLLEATPASKATSNAPEITIPFFEAVKLDDMASAQEFLVKHIDLKAIKDTPRLAACAAQSGSIQILNLVLVQKGSLKATGPDGLTALHHAAVHGHVPVIEHLLSKGVSWKAQTKKRKETALHFAIANNQPSAALALIRHKDAKLTLSDIDKQEPLHHASRTGDLAIVTALLSHGAKLNSTNAFGWKPAHEAAAYGHVSLMATFITHGIDLEDRLSAPSFKPAKKTNEAAQLGYWAEIRWPRVNSRALHLAIEFRHVEMAKLLLSAGAKADAPGSDRWRPLHSAAFNCLPEIVEILLDKGASPHATTQDGDTPLELGFRGVGLVASEDEKARVRSLLQEAMAKKPKSGLAQVLQFRLGSAGTKSVAERNRIYHTAEMAEALYRDGGVLASDDADSQVSEDRGGASAMSSSLTLSAVDRRTSSLSMR